MKSEIIPIEQTGLFPQLVRDYLSGNQDMEKYMDYTPDMQGLKAKLADAMASEANFEVLAQVIEEQHGSSVTSLQKKHIAALKLGKGYTITTGHQLCLFGGPAYLFYKIVSIITLAERLSKETGACIMPLFWMATEDHDIEEINHCHLFGKRVEIQSNYTGASGNMGTEAVEQSLAFLEEILGKNPKADYIVEIMRKSYSSSGTMETGMRALVQACFGEKGVLILDASDTRIKATFGKEMIQEITENTSEESMQLTLKALNHRGEKIQASPRPINMFYMREGYRLRIEAEGDNYHTVDGDKRWAKSEIEVELSQHPERFSPNVLMRPVYQEHILPNLAYVGGPGELSYWLQLKDTFHAFQLKMPVLLLRDSFLWLDSRSEERLKELNLGVLDLFRSEDALHAEYAIANAQEEPSLSEDRANLTRHFDSMIERSKIIDPGVAQFAEAERQKLLNTIANLEKKLVRAEKKKHSTGLDRISQLLATHLPNGGLAERQENFISGYLMAGDAYFDKLYESANPLISGVKVIRD